MIAERKLAMKSGFYEYKNDHSNHTEHTKPKDTAESTGELVLMYIQ
jgi:hypothetical protein